jgi:hypothetical protein
MLTQEKALEIGRQQIGSNPLYVQTVNRLSSGAKDVVILVGVQFPEGQIEVKEVTNYFAIATGCGRLTEKFGHWRLRINPGYDVTEFVNEKWNEVK